ncbi:poly(A)-specific ribonuclease PARN-like [Silene latifolia]|uniref:poly(A)-specific ribonuclease PARN-like n=1 Tax=Silene latifolia TaxID=37657 RepID=UPI003D77D1C4
MMNKRLLCTQAATFTKNTINNINSSSQKWRIKQVTKSNFNEALEEVKTYVCNSDFIAISLQKTGSYSSPWQKVLPFDTSEIAYLKTMRSAEKFQVFQFALCAFTLKDSHLTAYPFNFHLFPRDELHSGMPSYSFACQTSYLTSMARLGFDFNACIYDGISYLSKAQEAAMKSSTGNPMLRARAVESSRKSSVADTVFKERIKSRVRTWRNACKDSKGLHADPLVNVLRKIVHGDHQSRPSIDVDVCSERQVQLVLEVLKEFSDEIVPLLIPTKNGSTQGVRVVLTASKEDKDIFEKELEDQEEEQSKRVRGFREVIDLISASQKPIVVHNSLDELTSIHSKFLSPLPPSFEEFKGSLGSFFPHVIDLGHLMKEINPKGSTNNIAAASSLLRSRFFSPVTIDIPLKGTEDEMDGGKVHGHNVLRLSHTFAKLYSILKRNHRHLSNDNSFTLEKYANIFNTCSSSPLESSDNDGDNRTASGSIRKLSCDDLIFVWGFREGLSSGELKRLLSGSHEAFSGDFDVRLVDQSCAIVAMRQPGLTEAFLDSMKSGGTDHVRLRILISEGLRAANYETYRRIFDITKWDYNLADCLDTVVISSDQFPLDSHESRSPYEIWWDDDTVLNLDEV